MGEKDPLHHTHFESFPKTDSSKDKLEQGYPDLDFEGSTAQTQDEHVYSGNLQEKLGEKISDLLEQNTEASKEQLAVLLEQMEQLDHENSPEFFLPQESIQRLAEKERQLQFEADCLEGGVNPREAELLNFGKITSPKSSLIPFPKDEGFIPAISALAIAALLAAAILLDYFIR
jgi:hypothetical protein